MYLFEPYNAYQKPPKKKHWHEIIEEEALLHRMQLEEQSRRQIRQTQQQELFQEALKQHLALREANAKQNSTNLNNQNVALPQYTPQPAAQQVQDGQYASPAGGGYALPIDIERQEQAAFSATPQSGIGPLTVTFVNLSPTPDNDTFLWIFGSGSVTSTLATPPALTYTQIGSYTVTLQETSSTGNKTVATKAITVVAPSLIPSFSNNTFGVTADGFTASFTSSTTYNGTGGVISRSWDFGDGTTIIRSVGTLSNLNIPFTHSYNTIDTYTVSLSVTESLYNISGSTSSITDPYENRIILK